MGDDDVLDWLRHTDPALRWRVERDLLDAPDAVWQSTRDLVDVEGMAVRLRDVRDPDGRWAGGAFFPHGFDEANPGTGQPWTATTWSLTSLREWGMSAAALGDTAERLAESCRWEYGRLPYWGGEVDVCINAMTLANGSWLGVDMSGLRTWFVEHETAEGGWNCEEENGSTRASIRSTLNAVIGILDDEMRTGGTPELRAARHRAEEYLLERRLLRRKTTGEPILPHITHLAYPFRSAYSALRAADHMLEAALWDGTAPDPRIADAVETVRAARGRDGRWVQERRHAGEVWFEVDAPVGHPSPWLTYYALRVLRRWDELAGR